MCHKAACLLRSFKLPDKYKANFDISGESIFQPEHTAGIKIHLYAR